MIASMGEVGKMRRFAFILYLVMVAGVAKCEDLSEIRLSVDDWYSRTNHFSVTLTAQASVEGVPAKFHPEQVITIPIVSEIYWSPEKWHQSFSEELQGMQSTYFDGKVETKLMHLPDGSVEATVRHRSGSSPDSGVLGLFCRQMMLTNLSLPALLSQSTASVVSADQQEVTIEIELDNKNLDWARSPLSVELRFRYRDDWLLDQYRVRTVLGAYGNPERSVEVEHVSTYTRWAAVSDELTGESVQVPVECVEKFTEGGELESSVTLTATDVRLNPQISHRKFRPDLPTGTQVHEFHTEGGSPRKYIVGGQAALEKKIAEQESLIADSIAAVQASGVILQAEPENAQLPWIMGMFGCLFLAIAAYFKWRT